jgi:hypothetical protein
MAASDPAPSAPFAHVQAGCLPAGTATPLGVIDSVSLTAYAIADDWVPFHVLHGRPAPASPLVVLA